MHKSPNTVHSGLTLFVLTKTDAFLSAPNGTKEEPCVVTSSMPYRIVGATDPDDDSSVHWGRVGAGKPAVTIGEEWCGHKAG